MIKTIQVLGNSYDIDENTRKYAIKRIGRLDRYIPRHARRTASVDIKLQQVDHDHGNKFEAEVILSLPGKVITAKDSTVNILSAIDIVEEKIKAQISDYKASAIDHIGNRGAMSQFKRSFKRDL
jgi:putative sigma-54 modulation protein